MALLFTYKMVNLLRIYYFIYFINELFILKEKSVNKENLCFYYLLYEIEKYFLFQILQVTLVL